MWPTLFHGGVTHVERFCLTLVFGLPVLVGLAICQNTARGDDATDALLTAATSSGTAVAKPAEGTCAACEGRMRPVLRLSLDRGR